MELHIPSAAEPGYCFSAIFVAVSRHPASRLRTPTRCPLFSTIAALRVSPIAVRVCVAGLLVAGAAAVSGARLAIGTEAPSSYEPGEHVRQWLDGVEGWGRWVPSFSCADRRRPRRGIGAASNVSCCCPVAPRSGECAVSHHGCPCDVERREGVGSGVVRVPITGFRRSPATCWRCGHRSPPWHQGSSLCTQQ